MMPHRRAKAWLVALWLAGLCVGCAHGPRIIPLPPCGDEMAAGPQAYHADATLIEPIPFPAEIGPPTSGDTPPTSSGPAVELAAREMPASGAAPLTLDEVLASVYASYPLLEAALYSRDVAFGNHLAAHGQFDLKLKGAGENMPLGYYETYRQNLGLVQPLYSGCEVWGGYRIGRGDFQPWFFERNTNDGGEFKAGLSVPLRQNRLIDDRRAELWRTGLGRQLAEFDIRAQVIGFVQEASYFYWEWVAAGRAYGLAERVLTLADSRTDRIRRQVETGLIDPPELTDNLRLVAERRAKLADARRKLDQQAAKLSLFLRDAQGQPLVPRPEQLPSFPQPQAVDPRQLAKDIERALGNRPELQALDTIRQQLDVDLAQARNERQPEVNAVVWGSQDVGAPTSPKRNKSPFELETGLYVDVPLQRRKARGKMLSIQAKIQQLAAKRRLTEDKIAVDVQMAYVALAAAFDQVRQTREAVRLAEDLAQRERRNFEAGASDLLKVTLREEYAADAAVKQIDALLQYHRAEADYVAALAANPAP